MAAISRTDVRNFLLELASDEAFAALASHLEPLEASHGLNLFESDRPLDWVYFLDDGIGSLVSVSPEGHRAEIGLFGRDGFSPTSLVMGSDLSPYYCVVQIAGIGHRIATAKFHEIVDDHPDFRHLLLKYVQAHSVQASFTALSNAVHQIDERLARWLLMCHDRIDGDEIALTHEFLSIMLAVRRPSVTTSLHVLEGNNFIRSERGCVIVRNRAALEQFAHDAYGRPEAEYERLLRPLRRESDRWQT
ncbi:MAG: Crp/Fnr family transcriptional regulator [Pacificimonas sp.]